MIAAGWLNFEILCGIDHLKSLNVEIEELLKNRSDQYSNWLDEVSSSLSKEQSEEFYDFHLDEYWDLKEEFPNTLRKSILNTSYSFFENQLKNICKYINTNYKEDNEFKNITGSYIHKYKQYICTKKNINLDEKNYLWNKIDEYRTIRNHLVHEYGENTEQYYKPSEIVESTPLIYIKNTNIYLTSEYVTQFIDNIHDYLIFISNKFSR